MKSFYRATLVAFGSFISSHGLAAELVIGHVSLHLGMPQAEVLAALGKEFDPKQVSDTEGKFLLWTREPETRAMYSAGTVSFRDGKLYRASKAWGTGGIKGKDVAEGLFGVISALAGKEGRTCTIKAETLRVPPGGNGVDVRLVTIDMPPDRRVLVRIYEPHPSPDRQWIEAGPDVDEYLVDLSKPR